MKLPYVSEPVQHRQFCRAVAYCHSEGAVLLLLLSWLSDGDHWEEPDMMSQTWADLSVIYKCLWLHPSMSAYLDVPYMTLEDVISEICTGFSRYTVPIQLRAFTMNTDPSVLDWLFVIIYFKFISFLCISLLAHDLCSFAIEERSLIQVCFLLKHFTVKSASWALNLGLNPSSVTSQLCHFRQVT